MKRIVIAALAVGIVTVGFAEVNPPEAFLRKTGGFVAKPGTQKGEVVYVNCQKRAETNLIEESIAYFKEETKFKITLKDGSFDLVAPKVQGNASLFIVDDEKLPPLLVAPESRWAMVNIAPIAREQRPAYFQARVKKELTRGFAFLCGASNSQYPMALTRGIENQADLDRNPDLGLPVDVIHRFKSYMESFGVEPEVRATYRTAIKQGWAEKPADEYQKKIWDEMHEIPTEPIKIKPESHPKK